MSAKIGSMAQSENETSDLYLVKGYQQYKEGKYDSSVYNLEQASINLAGTANYEDYIYSLLYLGRSHQKLAYYSKAHSYLHKALEVSLKHLGENHDATARIYNGLDNNYAAQSKFNSALEFGIKALNTRINIYGKRHKAVIESYNAIASNIRSLGNYDSALVWYKRALELEKEVYEDYEHENNAARTIYGMGWVLGAKGEFAEALEYLLKSVKISENASGKDHPYTAQKLKMVAWCATQLGDYRLALKYSNRAAEIRIKRLGRNHPFMATTYHDLGRIYMKLGEYEKAIAYLFQGNKIWVNKYGPENQQMTNFHNNLGHAYFRNGDYTYALKEYKQAIAIGLTLKGDNRLELANSYSLLADLFEAEADYKEQYKYLTKSLNIASEITGLDHTNIAKTYQKLGGHYAKTGNHAAELEYYHKALNIFQNKFKGKHPIIAETLADIGDHYLNTGEHDKALNYYQISLAVLSKDFNNRGVFSNPEPRSLLWPVEALSIFHKKANALSTIYWQNIDSLQKTMSTYQATVNLIDHIKNGYVRESSKIDLYKNSRGIYNAAINTCIKLHDHTKDDKYLNEAFKYSEASKAMILHEVVSNTGAINFAKIPDSLTLELNKAKMNISVYREHLHKAQQRKDSAAVSRFTQKLFYTQNHADQLIKLVEETYPDYFNLKYQQRSVELSDVQNRLLSEQSALIEYFIGDSTIIVFTVHKNKAEMNTMRKSDDFARLIEDYRKSITDYQFIINNSAEADLQYIRTSTALFDLLINPSKEILEDNVKHLIIVPDGAIWHVNFQALLSSKPGENTSLDYRNLPYLINEYSSSFAYSASLSITGNKPSKGDIRFAGFAPSYDDLTLDGQDSISHNMLALLVRDGEYNLPGAQTEVRNITDVMQGVAYVGKDATENTFKQSGQQYDVIHLAMHSLINNKNPEYTELLFDKNDSIDDGFLSISEIYNLKLNAELIVLSACNSGYGTLLQGEGPISLSRAFNYAGCPSVVMSQWKIPDNATQHIMTDFYKSLKKGLNKDVALRAAQLNYLKNTDDPLQQHPFHWASFLNMGNTQPIYASSNSNTMIIILCFCGAAVMLIIFRVKKRKIQ